MCSRLSVGTCAVGKNGLLLLLTLTYFCSAYLSVTTESKVILDHFDSSSDDTLQVNFNVSFAHLKCEYASVDASNFMGTHDAGLAARVSKVCEERERICTKTENERGNWRGNDR